MDNTFLLAKDEEDNSVSDNEPMASVNGDDTSEREEEEEEELESFVETPDKDDDDDHNESVTVRDHPIENDNKSVEEEESIDLSNENGYYDVPLSPPHFPDIGNKRSFNDYPTVEPPVKRQKITTAPNDDEFLLYKPFQSFAEFNEGSWYVVAPPGSGKTAILKTFLWDIYHSAKTFELPFYPNYTTTIREELANFKKIIPKQLVSANFKVPMEKRITTWLNENFEKEKKVVVIYDDICSDDKGGGKGNKKASAWSTYQSELVRFGSRHYKAHYLITTQYYTVIDTTTRSSFTYSMCICKMGDVADLGAESVTKKLREMATIFKCDVEQLVTLVEAVRGQEEFSNNDRLVIVYHNQNKNFRWNLHRHLALETDEMKRYIDGYILDIPQCFIKNGTAKLMNMRRHEEATTEEESEWIEPVEFDGGVDLEKELTKITMLQSISKINPKIYELLSKSKRLDIIEKEYLKAKAMLNLRNKLNVFMILYDLVFVIIEYVDKRLNCNQCEGLTKYRDGMSEDEKNTERDIINSVIECYAPYLNQPSPLTDLTLHTITIILVSKAHNSMSRIVNTVASQLEDCDKKCKVGSKKGLR